MIREVLFDKQSIDLELTFREVSKEIKFILDENNVISYISDNSWNILGFEPYEMIGYCIFDFIGSKDSFLYYNEQDINNKEAYFVHKNGNKIFVEVQIKTIMDSKNKYVEKYGTMIDITKYADIKSREETLKVVLDNAKDIIYTFQVAPEPKFIYMSSATEQVFGYKVKKYYEDYVHIFNTSHPDDVPILYKKMNNELDYSKPIVSRWIHKNGHCVWIEDFVRPTYDSEGNLIAFEGVCRDISERKALEEKLYYLTYYDSLTGVKNRTFYDKQIEELNTINNIPIGVIVCDLDNLKIINDSIGHDKGDEVIKTTGSLLKSIENEHISISRIGGDEFVVLVNNTDEIEVMELCNEIESLINNHNKEFNEWPIEMSIGHAFTKNSFENMSTIFKIADKNMYENKLHKKGVKNEF